MLILQASVVFDMSNGPGPVKMFIRQDDLASHWPIHACDRHESIHCDTNSLNPQFLKKFFFACIHFFQWVNSVFDTLIYFLMTQHWLINEFISLFV